jgi:hypothetical protein
MGEPKFEERAARRVSSNAGHEFWLSCRAQTIAWNVR